MYAKPRDDVSDELNTMTYTYVQSHTKKESCAKETEEKEDRKAAKKLKKEKVLHV